MPEESNRDGLPKLELGDFEYFQDASRSVRIVKKVIDLLMRSFGMEGLVPPINKRISRRIRSEVYVPELAKVIGIDDPVTVQRLLTHWRRNDKFTGILFLTIALIVFSLTPFILNFGFTWALEAKNIVIAVALVIFAYLFLYVIFGLLVRIADAVLNRYYADSLAALSAFFIMIDLMHDRALENYTSRRSLQGKLSALSRRVLLLGSQYKSKSQEGNVWISTHFKKMEQYLLEREKLVVAPKGDTLDVLRQDFYPFLKILISGQYGDFNADVPPSIIPEKTKTSRIIGGLISAIGFLLPLTVLYILYTDPSRIEAMGVNTNTITIIALAWFLLAIDANLKLGIVERITGLAKAIRDLG